MNSGRGFAGTSGVHVHMTNSRLTDPEVLEMRFPVLLEHFGLRAGSGGQGAYPAGDGTERRLRFLERMDCAILSSHRDAPPRGIAGGGDGQVGRTSVRRLDGTVEDLRACDQTVLEAGEVSDRHHPDRRWLRGGLIRPTQRGSTCGEGGLDAFVGATRENAAGRWRALAAS